MKSFVYVSLEGQFLIRFTAEDNADEKILRDLVEKGIFNKTSLRQGIVNHVDVLLERLNTPFSFPPSAYQTHFTCPSDANKITLSDKQCEDDSH